MIKKDMKKAVSFKKYVIFGTMALLTLYPVTLEAKTHTYESSYSMKGGVFTKDYLKPTSYVKTTVTPIIGTEGCEMGIVWAKKCWYGWDGPVKYVSSTEGGSVKFKVSDRRKIWLRDFANLRWSGYVKVEWD